MPEPITPEMLLYGRELISLNVIPGLQADSQDYPLANEGSPSAIRKQLDSLRAANEGWWTSILESS